MEIRSEIERAARLSDQFAQLVASRSEYPSGLRNNLVIGYWTLIFDYHEGVLSLLSGGLYGSAFALLRPVVEAVVRAHIAVKGTEEDVQQIASDTYRMNFNEVGNEVDGWFGLDTLLTKFLSEAREILHSCTHSGLFQISRRFKGGTVEPNYPEGEIVQLIQICGSALFMATNLLTKYFGREDEWRRATQLFTREGAP